MQCADERCASRSSRDAPRWRWDEQSFERSSFLETSDALEVYRLESFGTRGLGRR